MDQENAVWKMIADLSNKKGITEIVINDSQRVFVERQGQFIQLNVDLTHDDIQSFCVDVAELNQKPFNEDHPILDGNLPDGSRINIIAEPFSHGSPAISIRKYLKHIQSFDQNPGVFGLDERWVEFFKACISARSNIVVSGGTGVGKTTFMNLLLRELSPQERVITIEDTLELSLKLPNVVRLEARILNGGAGAKSLTVRDLVKNTLRMRPDRIIIGETRGGELFDLLQAMNTGHDGSMTSIHSNNPGECLSRMETLFLFAGHDLPFHVVRKQIADGVDFIVQVSRNRSGERVISHISEITGMEGNNILSSQIATLEDGKLVATGITPTCMEQLHHMGALPQNFFNS